MSLLSKLKTYTPKSILTVCRIGRTYAYTLSNSMQAPLLHRRYEAYEIYYKNGTGIIDRIRFGAPCRIYEPELSSALVSELKKYTDPVFCDIGANIGLISLYILSHTPNVHIYAFEPGAHQADMFEVTIKKNNIDNRITLVKKALSDEAGKKTFYIHENPDHSGGDGFKKTERGGKMIDTEVETIIFDTWILQKKSPHVIKIDVEGAELYVLKGMKQTLLQSKPTIFLRCHPII